MAQRFAEIRQQLVNSITNLESVADDASHPPSLRDIFKQEEERKLLKELYKTGEEARQTDSSAKSSGSTPTAENDSEESQPTEKELTRRFRDRIWGDGPKDARSKILATLLFMDVDPTTDLWSNFINCLSLEEPSPRLSNFRDAKLPFEPRDIERFFGKAYIEAFDDMQLRFYPLDLTPKFQDVMEKFRGLIEAAKVTCQNFDAKGNNLSHEATDEFYPWRETFDIVQGQPQLVKRFYIEAFKVKQASTSDQREKRAALRNAQVESEQFLAGLCSLDRPRVRVFAILIYSSMTATSEAWNVFAKACIGQESHDELCDRNLPLKFRTAQRLFGSADSIYRVFYAVQHCFCATTLVRDEQVSISASSNETHLPLASKQQLGSGSYGTVYEVKVQTGHFIKHGKPYAYDKKLAMKHMTGLQQIDEAATNQLLFHQPVRLAYIIEVYASLKLSDSVYIFMELADCNLYEYMKGQCKSVPDNFEKRKEYFNLIINIAFAVRHLHRDLEEANRARIACIHKDLKAENILVKREDGKVFFKLTDFGISSIKRKADAMSNHGSSKDQAGSLRQKSSPTILGDLCQNAAPEAIDGGRVTASTDIWALGTVLAEYLAWLAGGQEELEAFETAREGKEKDDRSFRPDGRGTGVILNPGVEKWFKHLIKRTMHKQEKAMYESCWQLLQNHMLVCDPKKRANIEQVYDVLGKILREEADPLGSLDTDRATPVRGASATRHDSASPTNAGETEDKTHKKLSSEKPLWRPASGEKTLTKLRTRTSAKEDNTNSHSRSDGSQPNRPAGQKSQSTGFVDAVRDGEMTPASIRASLSSGADLEERDEKLRTPLLAALENKYEDVAKALLDSGANVSTEDKTGWTPLHYAARLPSPDITERLISIDPSIVNIQDREGHTPLHLCANSCLKASVQHAKELLKASADPTIKSNAGRTPLDLAMRGSATPNRTAMQTLLSTGVK